MRFMVRGQYRPRRYRQLALAQVEAGEYEAAELTVREARANIERAGMVRFEAALLLIDAHAALLQQKFEDCHELLRQGLQLAQQAGSYIVAAGYYAKTLPKLWTEALKLGIEVEYVRSLIRKHKTLPAPIEIEHWPWPIKIYTLGCFEILIDDMPLKFTGRTPRQPLQLLKLIVSLGGEANSETLCEALWPDAEGDAARLSLETALHRLRKVLRNDSAIVRQSNARRLDLSQCWIDAVAFDRLADRVLAGPSNASQTDLSSQAASEALALYRGNFLPDQSGESWTLSTRDRLREKFLRLTITRGLAIEQQGDLNAAIALYEGALQHDNLSENLYRHLIICHRQRGQAAEALKVYRRCRERLSIVLGVQPAAETQALYRTLL